MDFDLYKNRKKIYEQPSIRLWKNMRYTIEYKTRREAIQVLDVLPFPGDIKEDVVPIFVTALLIYHTCLLLLSLRPMINDIDADFILIVEDQEFRVHKTLLAQHSTFFESLFRFPGKESQDGRVVLHDESLDIIIIVLQFIYNGDYSTKQDGESSLMSEYWPHWSDWNQDYFIGEDHHDSSWSGWPGNSFVCRNASHDYIGLRTYSCQGYLCIHRYYSPSPNCERVDQTCQHNPEDMAAHALVYAAADYYGIFRLKALSEKKFRAAVHVTYPRFDRHQLIEAIRTVCTTTPTTDYGLRDPLAEFIAGTYSLLIDFKDIQRVLEDHGDLALGVLMYREWMKEREEAAE